MAITINVEDGSGVADANSYQDVATVTAYAADRGVALSEDVDVIAAQLIVAFDYLETKECDYQGTRVYAETAFPRTDVTINGVEIGEDEIPTLLKSAQARLVMAQNDGIDIFPNLTYEDYIIEDKIGPMTTKFANPSLVGTAPKMAAVDAMLAPLFGKCASGGFAITTLRV